MKIPGTRILIAALLLAAPTLLPAADSLQAIADRTLIRELMDLSISRYTDRYAKQNGEWRIRRREIAIEFGNAELGEQLGFGGR